MGAKDSLVQRGGGGGSAVVVGDLAGSKANRVLKRCFYCKSGEKYIYSRKINLVCFRVSKKKKKKKKKKQLDERLPIKPVACNYSLTAH